MLSSLQFNTSTPDRHLSSLLIIHYLLLQSKFNGTSQHHMGRISSLSYWVAFTSKWLHSKFFRFDGSGWTSVIADAGVTSTGVADSFIKASHLTRTRQVHQNTAANLYILQQRAYSKYKEVSDNGVEPQGFIDWEKKMSTEHPQFLYWC